MTLSIRGYKLNVNGKRHVNLYCMLYDIKHGQHQTGSNILLYWTKRWINYNKETIVMYPGNIMSNSHAVANVFTSTCQGVFVTFQDREYNKFSLFMWCCDRIY